MQLIFEGMSVKSLYLNAEAKNYMAWKLEILLK